MAAIAVTKAEGAAATKAEVSDVGAACLRFWPFSIEAAILFWPSNPST